MGLTAATTCASVQPADSQPASTQAARPPSLGLTLVHDLVRQLGGTAVTVSDGGVTVTITFPQGAAAVPAATAPQQV